MTRVSVPRQGPGKYSYLRGKPKRSLQVRSRREVGLAAKEWSRSVDRKASATVVGFVIKKLLVSFSKAV